MAAGKSKRQVCDPASVTLPCDESAEQLAKLAWAVAHPARVRIVRLLISRETCVCGEIVDELPLAQSTVSPAPQDPERIRTDPGRSRWTESLLLYQSREVEGLKVTHRGTVMAIFLHVESVFRRSTI